MHKFRNRVGLLIVLVMTSVIVFPNKVEAAQSATGNQTLANSACSNALFGGTMLTATKDSTNGYININAKNGIWNIKWYIGDTDDLDYSKIFGTNPISPTGTTTYKGGSGNYPITIPRTAEPQKVIVIAEATGDSAGHAYNNEKKVLKVSYTNTKGKTEKTTCKSGTIGLDTSNKVSITGTGAYISKTIPALSSKELKKIEDSSEEGTECIAMRMGKYNTDLTDSSYDLTGADLTAYNQQMQKSFPYCYGTSYNSSFEFNAKSIKRIRQASLKAYKQYLEFQSSQENNDAYTQATSEIASENFKEISYDKKTNSTTIGKLFCDKKATSDTTEKYYTKTTEADNKVCKVTCQEQIQVTYGPPVATKAGMCFQYKVTVRSKVTCMTEKKTDISWPTIPNTCGYTPICEGNANETQAGPSEEFDACINECDGGKYSQSCINKCYQQVYSNKTKNSNDDVKIKNTSITDMNKNSLIKLENKTASDPYYEDKQCDTNSKIKQNEEHCANYFYKLKQKYPMGYYYEAGKNTESWIDYLWKPCFSQKDSRCQYTNEKDIKISYSIDHTTLNPYSSNESYVEAIKRSSPYYFRNKNVALKTIQSFYAKNSGKNGAGDARYYVIDDGGIKRQRTSSYKCYETCGYIKDSNSGDNCKNSSKEVADDYVKKFENIEAELSSCTTKAECKNGEATFDIDVDYSKENENESKSTEWHAKNSSGITGHIDYIGQGDTKMFIPILPSTNEKPEILPPDLETDFNNGINGTCYGRDNASYWQHYKTTITFPGTWINLKTSKRVYYDNEADDKIMREKPNYYCVGYDYKPVNESWWDWKINGVGNIDNINIEKNDNIQATIASFGKYNWKVNLNCFYALSNKVTTCVGENCNPSCTGAECDTTISNVKLRPVDQADLFAGRTGDQIGFNWTSAAQDKVAGNISGYNIDPGLYAEQLQTEARNNPNSIYSGTADYSLHLTKENINELRKYVKENEGYTKYNGENKNKVEDVEGLYYYKSNILEDNKFTTNFSRSSNILGKNNN